MVQLDKAWAIGLSKVNNSISRFKGELWEFAEAADGQYLDGPHEKQPGFYDIGCWVSSFLTGMSLLGFEADKELNKLKWANLFAYSYEQKVFVHMHETMHDLGFLYSPYSVKLYKLTGDLNHRRTALRAAELLASRYVMNGGYIKAWGRMDETDPASWGSGIAIIDTMMNLPLLFWATEQTGNSFYRDIAMRHADMTMKLMVRADDSVYHAYRFDSDTGLPVGGCNYCGYGDESYWARGTAWAIYGFAIAYRYTRKQAYLDTGKRLASGFIAQLDEKVVPVWDFRLPDGEPTHRDSSAAAIASCGLSELAKHDPAAEWLKVWADRMLYSLAGETYVDDNPSRSGILKQSNGREVYTIYGDYFFMEALAKRRSDHYIECW